MESTSNWAAEIVETLVMQLRMGVEHLPNILGAIFVLLLGWILARLFRRITHSVAQVSNGLLKRAFPSGVLADVRMSPLMTTLLGEIVFWTVIMLALAAAARIGGFRTMYQWLDRIAIYLPNVIAAFAIVVVGYFLGIFVREQVVPRAGIPIRVGQTALAGRVAQGAVILITLIMGLDQLGIDVILPIILVAIGAAAIAITFGISIALGAQSHMSNVFGMRTAKGQLAAGLKVRIDGIDGQILEVTPSHIALETDEGRALLPGRLIAECVTFVYSPADQESKDRE